MNKDDIEFNEIYKTILELQIILLDRDLLSTPIDTKTTQEFLVGIQGKIGTDAYSTNHLNRETSFKDLALLSILKRHIDSDLANVYIDTLIEYICSSIEHAELVFNGNNVANKLIGSWTDDIDIYEDDDFALH